MRQDLPAAYRLPSGPKRELLVEVLPRNVFIEVTNRCNYRCTTCPHTYNELEPSQDLTLSELQVIAENFADMERAVLHGIGEPLLNPDLPRMIGYLKRRNVRVLFNSNGALLDETWARCMVLNLLDEYRLSLNTIDPEKYRLASGGGDLERVLRNVQGLISVKSELGTVLPRISIWCIGMKWNLPQIPDMIRLAAKMGIPEVYLQRLTYNVVPEHRQGLAQEETALFGNVSQRQEDLIMQCQELAAELGVSFRASGATDPHHSLGAASSADQWPWTACVRPWTTAYITANGNALPCCIGPFANSNYQELIMGNVWKTDFASIWNGQAYQRWRDALMGPTPNAACKGCGVYWSL